MNNRAAATLTPQRSDPRAPGRLRFFTTEPERTIPMADTERRIREPAAPRTEDQPQGVPDRTQAGYEQAFPRDVDEGTDRFVYDAPDDDRPAAERAAASGSAPPPLDGVMETCLYVEDVALSRAFYEKVFGFAPLGGDERMQPLAVAPGQVLILFKRGAMGRPARIGDDVIPAHDGGGEQHVAFGIAPEAFEAWRAHLNACDIAVESVISWPRGGRSLYFRDPDRLLLELASRGLWPNG